MYRCLDIARLVEWPTALLLAHNPSRKHLESTSHGASRRATHLPTAEHMARIRDLLSLAGHLHHSEGPHLQPNRYNSLDCGPRVRWTRKWAPRKPSTARNDITFISHSARTTTTGSWPSTQTAGYWTATRYTTGTGSFDSLQSRYAITTHFNDGIRIVTGSSLAEC